MKVLHVTSEIYPVVKTGGLADVAAALPAALARRGLDVRVLVPGYPQVLAASRSLTTVLHDGNLFGAGEARIAFGHVQGIDIPVYVLESKGLFGREGNPYVGADGHAWPDNHRRFAALGWAGARLGLGLDTTFVPDIVHGHDWQSGLVPAHFAFTGTESPKTVLTIHNLAYQGYFPAQVFGELGLPAEAFHVNGVEFHDGVCFLKGGIHYSDRITTVSRTYAQEIQEREHGYGLDGLLRHRSRDLVGIVNGVDYSVWSPEADVHLPTPYDERSVERKAESKRALRQVFGLPDDEGPLFGLVSRLNWHKGIDLVVEAIPSLAERAQLVVLGRGDPAMEGAFLTAAAAYPTRFSVRLAHDEALAHLLQAGSDVLLVPSRLEPCGLTQMYALRYGALPLVRRTGGLADTVVDATPANLAAGIATGFVFDDAANKDQLIATIERACDTYADRATFDRLRRAAMAQRFDWHEASAHYVAVYESLL